jgi:hypothetical protein
MLIYKSNSWRIAMKKKGKIRLGELKVESFVTTVEEAEKAKAGRGLDDYCFPTLTCVYPTLKYHLTCGGEAGCGNTEYTCGEATCSPSCSPVCETYYGSGEVPV